MIILRYYSAIYFNKTIDQRHNYNKVATTTLIWIRAPNGIESVFLRGAAEAPHFTEDNKPTITKVQRGLLLFKDYRSVLTKWGFGP